jgi:hypothetical protein
LTKITNIYNKVILRDFFNIHNHPKFSAFKRITRALHRLLIFAKHLLLLLTRKLEAESKFYIASQLVKLQSFIMKVNFHEDAL